MRKILVLDDQPDSLTTLRAILEHRGYGTVISASDPAAAVRICTNGCAIELLVCDIVLRAPMTGVEAAFEIRRSCPNLPILFTSGTSLEGLDQADFETLSQLLPACIDFLQKPFTAAQVVSAATRLLDTHTAPPEFVRAVQRAADNRQSLRKHHVWVRRAGS